jgi:hypothetical protein
MDNTIGPEWRGSQAKEPAGWVNVTQTANHSLVLAVVSERDLMSLINQHQVNFAKLTGTFEHRLDTRERHLLVDLPDANAGRVHARANKALWVHLAIPLVILLNQLTTAVQNKYTPTLVCYRLGNTSNDHRLSSARWQRR